MPRPLIERYREHLPLEAGDPVVTLNEGSTPLVEAPVISERVGARVLLRARARHEVERRHCEMTDHHRLLAARTDANELMPGRMRAGELERDVFGDAITIGHGLVYAERTQLRKRDMLQ